MRSGKGSYKSNAVSQEKGTPKLPERTENARNASAVTLIVALANLRNATDHLTKIAEKLGKATTPEEMAKLSSEAERNVDMLLYRSGECQRAAVWAAARFSLNVPRRTISGESPE